MAVHEKLALNGGPAVRGTPWPPWPGRHEEAAAALREAAMTGRWTLTGPAPATGDPPLERRFAEAFASWNGVPYCVTADHGTSALVMALEALGVGAGDEVIVPALTWVASATAVLRVNAVPVFADVDPATGCLCPTAVEAAVTPRTAAVIAVHLHHLMADMDVLRTLADRYGLALIEDAAQAAGAVWAGRKAGTLGDAGAFSMHQTKVLTAGEGGAVVTHDADLYRRLQQARADSSVYDDTGPAGTPCLQVAAELMGTNYCLTEFQAAILLARLPSLEDELVLRDRAARRLGTRLADVPGLRPLTVPEPLERLSVFEYAVARTPDSFAGRSTELICRAVSAELALNVHMTDDPLESNPRFRPESKAAWRGLSEAARRPSSSQAVGLHRDLLVFHHAALLDAARAVDDITEAFAKVARCADDLPLLETDI